MKIWKLINSSFKVISTIQVKYWLSAGEKGKFWITQYRDDFSDEPNKVINNLYLPIFDKRMKQSILWKGLDSFIKETKYRKFYRYHSSITFFQRRVGGSGKIWQLDNGRGGGGSKNMIYDSFTLGNIGNFNSLLIWLKVYDGLQAKYDDHIIDGCGGQETA